MSLHPSILLHHQPRSLKRMSRQNGLYESVGSLRAISLCAVRTGIPSTVTDRADRQDTKKIFRLIVAFTAYYPFCFIRIVWPISRTHTPWRNGVPGAVRGGGGVDRRANREEGFVGECYGGAELGAMGTIARTRKEYNGFKTHKKRDPKFVHK